MGPSAVPASHDFSEPHIRVGQADGAPMNSLNVSGGETSYPPSSRSSNNETDSASPPPSRIDSPDSADGVFVPILPAGSSSARASTFISSPLNPSAIPESPYSKVFNSLGRKSLVARFPSEEARALGNSSASSRNSMILYHVVDTQDDTGPLPSPPRIHASKRESVASESGESIVSLSSDSKYPSGQLGASERGLVAYAYDPELDDGVDDDWEDDVIAGKRKELVSARAVVNIGGLILLFLALMALFLVLPVTRAVAGDEDKNWLISHNPMINSTGQAQEVFDPIGNQPANGDGVGNGVGDGAGNGAGNGGGNGAGNGAGDGTGFGGDDILIAGKRRRRRNQTPAIDSIRKKDRRNETPAFDSLSVDPSTPTKARKLITPRSTVYDLVFSRESYTLCDSPSPSPTSTPLFEHFTSYGHLVEVGNQDGSRSFWQNGIWEHVFDASVSIPPRLSYPRRRYTYTELDMDHLCNEPLKLEYIRIYRVS